jgi:hypothetical protein
MEMNETTPRPTTPRPTRTLALALNLSSLSPPLNPHATSFFPPSSPRRPAQSLLDQSAPSVGTTGYAPTRGLFCPRCGDGAWLGQCSECGAGPDINGQCTCLPSYCAICSYSADGGGGIARTCSECLGPLHGTCRTCEGGGIIPSAYCDCANAYVQCDSCADGDRPEDACCPGIPVQPFPDCRTCRAERLQCRLCSLLPYCLCETCFHQQACNFCRRRSIFCAHD